MSLFGSLFSAVSGLTAQSQAMGMISDNVSNVNTVSYKGAAAQFSTLVTRSAASADLQPRRRPRQHALPDRPAGPDPGAATRRPTSRSTATASSWSTAAPMAAASSSTPAPAASSRTSSATWSTTPASICRAGRSTPSEQVININQLEHGQRAGDQRRSPRPPPMSSSAPIWTPRQTPFAGAYAAGDMAAFNAIGRRHRRRSRTWCARSRCSIRSAARTIVQLAFLKDAAANTWNVEIYADPAEVEAGEPSRRSARQRHRHLQRRRHAREHQHHAQLPGGRGRRRRSASTGSTPAGRTTARSPSISAPSAPPTASASSSSDYNVAFVHPERRRGRRAERRHDRRGRLRDRHLHQRRDPEDLQTADRDLRQPAGARSAHRQRLSARPRRRASSICATRAEGGAGTIVAVVARSGQCRSGRRIHQNDRHSTRLFSQCACHHND